MAMNQVATSKKCEQRAVIKFLNMEGVCGNEVHKCTCNVFVEGVVKSRQSVYKWFRLFNVGKTETNDEEHLGHQLDLVNEEVIVIVQTFLSDNWQLTVTNIFNKIAAYYYSYVNVSRTSINHILRNELDKTKVSVWWVP